MKKIYNMFERTMDADGDHLEMTYKFALVLTVVGMLIVWVIFYLRDAFFS